MLRNRSRPKTMRLSKKPKTPPKSIFFDKKNHDIQASCFRLENQNVFECVFGFFLTKESLILSAFKQKILDEFKQ